MSSTLQDKLDFILSEAAQETVTKVASVQETPEITYTNSDSQGLQKLAHILRQDVEPSYSDLYEFIGALR